MMEEKRTTTMMMMMRGGGLCGNFSTSKNRAAEKHTFSG